MELNAIYENGRLYFDGAIKLKMKRIPVRVLVDDEAVMRVHTEDMSNRHLGRKTIPLLQKIHNVLGPDYEYVPTDKTDKDMLFEILEEKYQR